MTPEQRALAQAYKRVFHSDDGKQVLDDLEHRIGLMAVSVQPGQTIDANTLIWQEGRRWVTLYILAKVTANLDEKKPETAQTEENKDG